jgi:uridine kinase
MRETITLRLVNSGVQIDVAMGTSLAEVLDIVNFDRPYPILVARVNNRYKELNHRIFKPVTVEFLDVRHYEGYRTYQRTISFVMQMAATELFPERKLSIRHTLGSGFYAQFENGVVPTAEELQLMKARMTDIVERDLPIIRRKRLSEEVAAEYARYGFDDRLDLVETRPHL